MQPINEFLNSIKRDKSENKDEYELYYHDRLLNGNLSLKFRDIRQIDTYSIIILKNNREISLPLQRVMEVKKRMSSSGSGNSNSFK